MRKTHKGDIRTYLKPLRWLQKTHPGPLVQAEHHEKDLGGDGLTYRACSVKLINLRTLLDQLDNMQGTWWELINVWNLRTLNRA